MEYETIDRPMFEEIMGGAKPASPVIQPEPASGD
jgi:hypothetical protein